ncbi:MAG TPA: PilT/PilU family type 4a pilus ATPase, partial [Polyangiales bacterium]|nr:PilT/PilU family type 4a pilus ATPase [Polyangiales bacterium]
MVAPPPPPDRKKPAAHTGAAVAHPQQRANAAAMQQPRRAVAQQGRHEQDSASMEELLEPTAHSQPTRPRAAPAAAAAVAAHAESPAQASWSASQPTTPADSPFSNAGAPDPSSPHVQWLHRVLVGAAKKLASDIHIHAGSRVKIRRFGDLVDLSKDALSAVDAEAILSASLYDWQREALRVHGEVDFAYSVPHVGRYRVNVYRSQSGLSAAYHYIPAKPPELDELGLPDTIRRLVNHQNGIVLITGPSGCGKTSTMAALVNIINHDREDHILSIEDPIEYVHPSKQCVINQRQVHRHTKSFGAALKSALREDPDIICIGELRDLETISLALSAAETGHLVLGTLHTQGAVRTINRVIGAYPSRQQPQIRTMLSESLRAVISQKLLPRADGQGVVVAYELLLMNHAAANLIRENRTFQL